VWHLSAETTSLHFHFICSGQRLIKREGGGVTVGNRWLMSALPPKADK